MDTYNVTTARTNLYSLLNEVNQNHKPIQILGKTGNAILLSEDDWKSIEETLFLNSIPEMTRSIISASNEPLEECVSVNEVEW